MKKSLLYLTGFMSAGKSTIGPILANTLGWQFLDLDRVIEQKVGKIIVNIFQEDGEDYFRKTESVLLNELSQLSNYVIALGGGTIESNENLKVIKNSGLLIYLETSPEAAYKRLRYKRDRPALLFEGDEEPSKQEFLDRINSILKRRIKYYKQADITVSTDYKPVGKTVDYIVSLVKKELKINEN